MERKIVNYFIVTEFEPAVLGRRIDELITGGWQPFGELTIVDYKMPEYGPMIFREMVKYEESEETTQEPPCEPKSQPCDMCDENHLLIDSVRIERDEVWLDIDQKRLELWSCGTSMKGLIGTQGISYCPFCGRKL